MRTVWFVCPEDERPVTLVSPVGGENFSHKFKLGTPRLLKSPQMQMAPNCPKVPVPGGLIAQHSCPVVAFVCWLLLATNPVLPCTNRFGVCCGFAKKKKIQYNILH
jgi:hypothetical protein